MPRRPQLDGHRISTLDLVGPGFTLLAASDGAAWRDAGTRVASELGIPIRGVLAADAGWDELAGTGASGVLLVRPDGHVAWRARDRAGGDSAAMLADALRTVLGR
ncbi:MAG: aromatic-ring hydroxylase C-terminal domain-containing protein [Candidatus Limnocylindrales bacterium]